MKFHDFLELFAFVFFAVVAAATALICAVSFMALVFFVAKTIFSWG